MRPRTGVSGKSRTSDTSIGRQERQNGKKDAGGEGHPNPSWNVDKTRITAEKAAKQAFHFTHTISNIHHAKNVLDEAVCRFREETARQQGQLATAIQAIQAKATSDTAKEQPVGTGNDHRYHGSNGAGGKEQ